MDYIYGAHCEICKRETLEKINDNAVCSNCGYFTFPTANEKEDIEISPKEAQKLIKNGALLLDVREVDENKTTKIEGSLLIPLKEIIYKIQELSRDSLIITHCHHGVRSEKAARFLNQKGYNAKSMKGGIEECSLTVDPKVARY